MNLEELTEHARAQFPWPFELRDNIRDHAIIDKAAQMAYFLMFAVIPALVALLGILSQFELTHEVGILNELIQDAVPGVVADLLVKEVDLVANANASGRIVVGFAIALFATQRAMHGAIQGVNRAWGTREDRPFWMVRGLVVILTVGMMASIVGTLVLLSVGQGLVDWVEGHGWMAHEWLYWLQYLRWPVVLVLSHTLINFIYRIGANTPLKRFSWSTWGTLFATASWIAITLGFRIYVSVLIELGAAYGSLGAAGGLLLYFYALSAAVFLGAEIDALNWHRKQRRVAQEPPGGAVEPS